MAISALSSSLLSFLSPSTPTSKTHCQSPHKSKTHLGFPLFSPSISLYTQKNPRTNRKGGLTITSMGKAINVQIAVEEDEPEDSIINRFNRAVLKAGVFQESRRRRYFESRQERKKRKAREAMRRNRRRRFPPRTFEEENAEELAGRAAKEEDEYDLEADNWELPEGVFPY
ncbi:hypothetical protein Cgig2_020274 [Carnegiea gigantea]|uniref:Ribosomal protein S21 n=1 Tax=Carnegiea gigantea TaxID=171969 RepID=A0A9Q1KW42_9CARY|nr:hypothetical protein Cgig2_020274 [Carnegiea gigantea]